MISRSTTARSIALGWIAFSVLALVPLVGSVMHENDQAALICGSLRLARGATSPWSAEFYNYDKQFVTYWLLAGLRRLFGRADPVALGNILSFVVFWAGAAAAVLRGRISRIEQAVAIGACLLSPAIWIHAPYLGTSTVSAGFLLLAWSVWPRAGDRPRQWLAALVLIALAVGSRADALLVLPWFAWTLTPRDGWRVLRRPSLYWIGGTGLLTLLAGRLIYTGTTVDSYPPFLKPRLYAAYLLFGLGAAFAVLILFVVALWLAAHRRRARPSLAAFYALGALLLLLPWAFYSVQLYSTRYWTPLLCCLLVGVLSPRGRALVQVSQIRVLRLAGSGGLLVGTVAPLVVGLHLPFPNRPSLVVSQPTLFPTGDGFHPMGAIGSFLHFVATTPGHIVDHNQALWLSASQAELHPDGTGRVPVLEAPMQNYLQLSAEIQGLESYLVTEEAPFYYTDTRDLLRVFREPSGLLPLDRLWLSATLHVLPVAPVFVGNGIVRADRVGAPDPAWRQRWALARAFGGNEYRVLPPSALSPGFVPSPADEGKTLILFAATPFAASLRRADGTVTAIAVRRIDDPLLFLAVLRGADLFGSRLVMTEGTPSAAITIHPDYMAVDKL